MHTLSVTRSFDSSDHSFAIGFNEAQLGARTRRARKIEDPGSLPMTVEVETLSAPVACPSTTGITSSSHIFVVSS